MKRKNTLLFDETNEWDEDLLKDDFIYLFAFVEVNDEETHFSFRIPSGVFKYELPIGFRNVFLQKALIDLNKGQFSRFLRASKFDYNLNADKIKGALLRFPKNFSLEDLKEAKYLSELNFDKKHFKQNTASYKITSNLISVHLITQFELTFFKNLVVEHHRIAVKVFDILSLKLNRLKEMQFEPLWEESKKISQKVFDTFSLEYFRNSIEVTINDCEEENKRREWYWHYIELKYSYKTLQYIAPYVKTEKIEQILYSNSGGNRFNVDSIEDVPFLDYKYSSEWERPFYASINETKFNQKIDQIKEFILGIILNDYHLETFQLNLYEQLKNDLIIDDSIFFNSDASFNLETLNQKI